MTIVETGVCSGDKFSVAASGFVVSRETGMSRLTAAQPQQEEIAHNWEPRWQQWG